MSFTCRHHDEGRWIPSHTPKTDETHGFWCDTHIPETQFCGVKYLIQPSWFVWRKGVGAHAAHETVRLLRHKHCGWRQHNPRRSRTSLACVSRGPAPLGGQASRNTDRPCIGLTMLCDLCQVEKIRRDRPRASPPTCCVSAVPLPTGQAVAPGGRRFCYAGTPGRVA